jgi:hypothetical protein
MAKSYKPNSGQHLREQVHKMFASQNAAVSCTLLVIEELLHLG